MFIYYYKRSVQTPIFAICVLLQTIIMLLGCKEELGFAMNNLIPVLLCYSETISIGIAQLSLPLLSVIPFLYHQVEEIHTGALYFSQVRTTAKKELTGRIGAAALSAMTMAALSLLLFTCVALAMGASWQTNELIANWFENAYYEELLKTSTWQVYLIHGAGYLLFSVPWVLIGTAGSLWIRNKYLVFAFPFVIFEISNFIVDLTNNGWLGFGYIVLLKNLKTRTYFADGLGVACLYTIVFCGVWIVAYVISWKRRWRRDGI